MAYEKYAGTAYDKADAKAAYAAAEAAADALAKDINNAALSSFAAIATAMDLPQLSDNAEKLVNWGENGVPAEAAYDAKLEDIAEAAALYNKAKALVVAYDEWKAATLPSEETDARAVYEAAYEAITAEELALTNTFGDSNSYDDYYVGCKTTFATAYNERYNEIDKADAEKVAAAKKALTGKAWDAIVGADLTASDIEANLKAQVEKVLADEKITGVTVSFDSYKIEAPAVGTTETTVWFQIDLKCGAAEASVGAQTVAVTNNWSNASLTKAVEKYITSYECSAGATQNTYEVAFKGAIEGVFPALKDVTVSVTLGGSVNVGDTFQVAVTATDPVAGDISVTATATITR